MADRNRFNKKDSIARSLFESCMYPFQGTVMYRAKGHGEHHLSAEECLLPYSGLLCAELKNAA